MKQIAALSMFLAWLLYGAMPAIGMPAIGATAMHGAVAAASGHHGEHRGATERHAMMGGAAPVAASDPQQACPHGGKICSAPFCAGCLTTLPFLGIGTPLPFLHQAPAPAQEQAFASPRPAPPIPPPRA